MRLHITSRPRIIIIPPGTAQMAAAFQNNKIIETFFFKLNSRANTGEAGAYDELVVLGAVHGVKIAM